MTLTDFRCSEETPCVSILCLFSCLWMPLRAWVRFHCTLLSCSLARNSLFIHSDLPAYLAAFIFVQMEPELGRGDFWTLTNFLVSSFFFFQDSIQWTSSNQVLRERGQNILSWSPGLWFCFSVCSQDLELPHLMVPQCSQGCLLSSHPQRLFPCWWAWGPGDHLCWFLYQSENKVTTHALWESFELLLACCAVSLADMGQLKSPRVPKFVKIKLFLRRGPDPLLFPAQVVNRRRSLLLWGSPLHVCWVFLNSSKWTLSSSSILAKVYALQMLS